MSSELSWIGSFWKNIPVMVTYVIVLFLLSYMEEKMTCHQPKGKSTWLHGERQDELHLWLHRRKGTAFQKRQEAQRISKINKWKESVPVLWCKDDVTAPKPSPLHRQYQLRRGSSSLVSLPWWPWACGRICYGTQGSLRPGESLYQQGQILHFAWSSSAHCLRKKCSFSKN